MSPLASFALYILYPENCLAESFWLAFGDQVMCDRIENKRSSIISSHGAFFYSDVSHFLVGLTFWPANYSLLKTRRKALRLFAFDAVEFSLSLVWHSCDTYP